MLTPDTPAPRLPAVASADLSPVAARRDALASALLEETLAGLAGLTQAMRIGPIGLDEFVRTLVAALESLEIEDRSERAGSVRALGVLDARGLDFDAVYVLGLDDGTFPAARSESPLCPDALKRQLNPLAAARLRATLGAHVAGLPLGGLLRTARESSLEEPFLFFLTLSMAERELVLSYPAADERGSTTVRSPFLDEVDACLGGGLVPERADPGRIVPELRDACEPAELIGRAALERWTRRGPRSADAGAACRCRESARHACTRSTGGRASRTPCPLLPGTPRRREGGADGCGFVGRLGAAAPALAARLDGLRWQPTSLEWFAACGFKFFAARVLGLEDSQPAGLEVDFRERGHAVPRRRRGALPAASGPAGRSGRSARARRGGQAAEVRRVVAHTIGAKDLAFLDVEWGQLERALDGVVVCEHAIQQALCRGRDHGRAYRRDGSRRHLRRRRASRAARIASSCTAGVARSSRSSSATTR